MKLDSWGEKILDIFVVINGVVSLFLIMLIGMYGSKKKIITSDLCKGLTEFMLKITLPFMIVSSFVFTYDDTLKANVVKSFYYSVGTLILGAIISYIFLIPLRKTEKSKILQFANVFSNCGYMGFPIINSIFGGEGVIYTSIFNMFFTMLLWTYGVMLFKGEITLKESKKVLLNPAVVAVYIGLAIMIFNIPIPDVILTTMETVGGMTTPLSMIIVGVILSRVDIMKYIKDWTIYYEVFIRLLIIPIGIYLVTLLIKDSSKVAHTMIILSAMPAAAMTSILAESFNKEQEYASVVVFFTTLVSIVTFPLILKLIT